jgi:membrane-associated phospholipid phosphatase
MKLRLIAMFMIVMFGVIGLALILVGIAIFSDVLVGGLVAFLIGCGLMYYDLRLALGARRGQFPSWIRDLVGAPL